MYIPSSPSKKKQQQQKIKIKTTKKQGGRGGKEIHHCEKVPKLNELLITKVYKC
jgi:hypothetical protein